MTELGRSVLKDSGLPIPNEDRFQKVFILKSFK